MVVPAMLGLVVHLLGTMRQFIAAGVAMQVHRRTPVLLGGVVMRAVLLAMGVPAVAVVTLVPVMMRHNYLFFRFLPARFFVLLFPTYCGSLPGLSNPWRFIQSGPKWAAK
jgi:hypothetical protein